MTTDTDTYARMRTRGVLVAALMLAAACGSSAKEAEREQETPGYETQGSPTFDEGAAAQAAETGEEPAEAQRGERAVAAMSPTAGNSVAGSVVFEEQDDGRVKVTMSLQGFEPNSTHAVHVHENGDCSAPDGTSAGGHYAPQGHDHALPDETPRHAGDMGNVTADGQGNVQATKTFDNFSVQGGEAPVQGKSVIVHASKDTGAQPSGAAGARVSCGVIVWSEA